jgi:hypothetical protein
MTWDAVGYQGRGRAIAGIAVIAEIAPDRRLNPLR